MNNLALNEKTPKISFVVTCRNDNHGGNLLYRLQLFVDGLIEQCKQYGFDAELILVTSGTITATTRIVIDEMRDNGESVGLLKIRLFRPFPAKAVQDALANCKRVAVVYRNICVGMGGIFGQEVKAALYNEPEDRRPEILDYIVGLGGRDVTPPVIEEIIRDAQTRTVADGEEIWIGLKE